MYIIQFYLKTIKKNYHGDLFQNTTHLDLKKKYSYTAKRIVISTEMTDTYYPIINKF